MKTMRVNCELMVATGGDMDEVSALESSSFPSDEAASDETIRDRQRVAGDFFYVIKNATANVVGFVNGTCIEGDTITHESMTEHRPKGTTLVIHSVTVSPASRREGLGSLMLKNYVTAVGKNSLSIRKILLLSKAYLLRFYVSCGFSLVGLSPVEHGNERWFEMQMELSSQSQSIEQYQVDAFSDLPFGGNPAAVVFEHRDAAWMQSLAAENNLSETAFVQLRPGTSDVFDIRWFTPTSEVDLCGHATLASAHALYDSGRISSRDTPITFITSSGGELTATGLKNGMIQLNFPSTPPSPVVLSDIEVENVLMGLSINKTDLLYAGRTVYDLFLEINASAFMSMKKIDFQAISKLGGRGVIVTCEENSSAHDFVSRFFGPSCGIDEDPVTGSAHCALAPYWFEKLKSHQSISREEVKELIGYQASKRGGVVHVALGDGGKRVYLSGSSVTVIKSKLFV